LTLADVELAVRGATLALTGKLIDLEHAVGFTSEYFGVEDTARLIAKLKEAQAEQGQSQDMQTMGYPGGPFGPAREEE
jgi:hypothetical protein